MATSVAQPTAASEPFNLRSTAGPAAIGFLTAAAFVILAGVLSDAIPTPLFRRMTPLVPHDYVLLGLNAVLLGSLVGVSVWASKHRTSMGTRGLWGGGIGAWFAISCPLCNALLVGVIGGTTVLNFIEPLRAPVGIASAAFLSYMLYRRIQTLRSGCDECEVAEPQLSDSSPATQ